MSPLDTLASRLPDGAVSTDPETLRGRAVDSWSLALLRQVRGDELPEPAAVIRPADTAQVATILAWATETGTAVIPRGGGSGVCGGAQADHGSVVLDLSRMDRIGPVDAVSQTVDAEAGVRGDRLEAALAENGLTTGHYPQSIALSTVGGWIAASSAGQASTGFGAIEDMLLGLTAVLPDGEILRLRPVPRSAAGPDLRRLLIGSEGTLGVVTEATLACRTRPDGWEWLAYGLEDFTALADVLKDVRRAETGAAMLRGYDETDAQLSFGALGHTQGCVALAGFPAGPAAPPGLDARMRAAAGLLRRAGTDLTASYGEHWQAHRNDAVQTYAQIQVSQPAVHQPGGAPRRPGGEVVLLHQRHGQPPRRRVQRDAGPGDPASDNQHVDRVLGHPGQVGRARPRRELQHQPMHAHPAGSEPPSAQIASRIGMLLPYDAVMSESTPAGVPSATFPVTTGLGLTGTVIERDLGLTFGLVVRSMGVAKSFGASFTALRQGEVPQYTRLLEDSRRHAIDRMIENAQLLGANAIVAMRFDSSEISQQLTEIVAYGTAVVVRPAG